MPQPSSGDSKGAMVTGKDRSCTIAIAGNPNSGKTTLFNGLTGSNQHIGNWPGVTVEKKEGTYRHGGRQFHVVDLPGIYSLSALTEDEKVAQRYLLSGGARVIVNILDATNLERNLYLTTQLLEMKVPLILVLNMMDLAERRGIQINVEHMAAHLGCPVIPVSAVRRADIERVREELDRLVDGLQPPDTRIAYSNEVEEAIAALGSELREVARELGADERWAAVKLLEQDQWVTGMVLERSGLTPERLHRVQAGLEKVLGEPTDMLIADYRYGFCHGIVRDVVRRRRRRAPVTERIDQVVLSRAFSVPIFLIAMYLLFLVAVSVGGAFIDFFDILVGTFLVDGFGALLAGLSAPPWAVTVLAGGLGGALQTVATFVPIIFMMFFMLSLFEDSGYMARAAFVADRFMRWIGLPGKAFVPLLVGFGCTVPAIMATRTLENRRDRVLTVLISPLMSCGARFPVYALFAAVFFPGRTQVVVFSLYLVGIVLAILNGLVLKLTVLRGEPTPFVMELPPYHSPRLRHIMHHSWIRLRHFLGRAGRVLIPMVMLLSIMNAVGVERGEGIRLRFGADPDRSVLAMIGRALTPVFGPMGVEPDNWPASVALFSGIFAKEAVVSTLNALYGQMEYGAPDEEAAPGEIAGPGTQRFEPLEGTVEALLSIPRNLAALGAGFADVPAQPDLAAGGVGGGREGVYEVLRRKFGEENGSGPRAYAYLLFVLMYFPCLAAFATMIQEIGLGAALFDGLYLTMLGWMTATFFYQVAAGGSLLWIAVSVGLALLTALGFRLAGRSAALRL
ncbi:MAG: ferrous iron transport protein B [Spirochaetota bacterium]